ncbi:3-hydroxyacyl-CoA dehydrogenase NAD-binding domain-containing protein [Streptomyces sp. NPDC035033]|uniref:3-hydroxyacyl-CoA dehydrogenase family protein n=1 Tax=Streptomyces sp. NPDC035033 TaxID=3155368 RepID=UPI00340FCCD7
MSPSAVVLAAPGGLGAIGAELAVRAAAGQLAVTVVTDDRTTVGAAYDRLERTLLQWAGERRLLAPERLLDTRAALTVVTFDEVRDEAGVAVEVCERPHERARTLARLAAAHPGALLVSTGLVETVRGVCPPGAAGRTVGLRPLFPDRARAFEVATTLDTVPEAARRAEAFVKALGAQPVLADDRPGGVAPALVLGLANRAARMAGSRYASADTVDTALGLGCGLATGPLRMLDEIGLDAAGDALDALHRATGNPAFDPAPELGRLVADGRYGVRSGHGFHRYRTTGPEDAGAPADAPRAHGLTGTPTVGVIGTGTMARGIAEAFLRAGLPVVQSARTPQRAAETREALADRFGDAADTLLAGWTGAAGLEAAARCDLVVEAVVEDPDVKRELFAALGRLAPAHAVLATSTSSLSVADLAAAGGRAADVVGLHFFNPAPTNPLVEVVTTAATSPRAERLALDVCAHLGKRAVRCADRTGFVVNALLFPYLNDVLRAVEEGVDPALVNKVAKTIAGFPVGPTRLLDIVGTDVALEIQRRLHEESPHGEPRPARLLRDLVASGHLGAKNRRPVQRFLDARLALTPAA